MHITEIQNIGVVELWNNTTSLGQFIVSTSFDAQQRVAINKMLERAYNAGKVDRSKEVVDLLKL